MPANRVRSMRRNEFKKEYNADDIKHYFCNHQNVLCRTCRQAGSSLKGAMRKTYKGDFSAETQCSMCGVHRNVSAFRRTKGKRTTVCQTCEVMPCAACKTKLPQTSFRPTDVSNHFSHAQTVICVDCRQRGCSTRRFELHRCAGPCNKLLGGAWWCRKLRKREI